jgi:hypothetical protein
MMRKSGKPVFRKDKLKQNAIREIAALDAMNVGAAPSKRENPNRALVIVLA